MVLSVEKAENSIVRIRIEISKEAFNDGMYKAYLKQRGQFNLPGFRKGKAPKKIIENYYGEAIFYEDAIDEVFPEAYKEAIEKNDLEPVERPNVKVEQCGSDKNLIVVAEVTVRPEVKLGEYKGLTIEKPEVKVLERDVKAEIEKARESVARFVTVERKVKNGDVVNLDYSGSCDGVAFDGGTAEGQQLTIGSGQFIPGFEEQMVGMTIGEEKDLTVTFPEVYHAADLAGKEAVFHVKVNEIKEKQLPKVDDEFVKDVSEFDTLDEYKADIRAKLEKQAEAAAKEELSNNALDAAMANVEVEIPEVMIDNEIGIMIRDLETKLRYQGFDMASYLKYTGTTLQQLKDEYREDAVRFVKARLTMEEIQKIENIEVTDEMVDAYIAEKAELVNRDFEEYKKLFRPTDIDYIKSQLKWQATIDVIIENGKVRKAKKKAAAKEEVATDAE